MHVKHVAQQTDIQAASTSRCLQCQNMQGTTTEVPTAMNWLIVTPEWKYIEVVNRTNKVQSVDYTNRANAFT